MKHIGIGLLTVTVIFLGATPAVSHHNRASYFDMDAIIEHKNVTAVAFNVVNPHSQLVFMVTDDQGNEEEWTAGILGASHLRRAGITPDLISPGDNLSIVGSPSRGEKNTMWLYTVVLANGDVADLFNAIRSGVGIITPAGSAGTQ
jgi:hypothetical protein